MNAEQFRRKWGTEGWKLLLQRLVEVAKPPFAATVQELIRDFDEVLNQEAK